MNAASNLNAGHEPTELTDLEHFRPFFDRNYPGLVRGLALMLGNSSDAEEVAQETFVRVLERWERVRAMDSPEGYLYAVGRNIVRKQRTRNRLIPFTGEHRSHDAEAGLIVKLDVLMAMESLEPKYRDTLVLHDWFGLTAEECGGILRISPGAVRVRLHRGRSRLRFRLGGEYDH